MGAVQGLGQYALVSAKKEKPKNYWEIEAQKLVLGINKTFRNPLVSDWLRTKEKSSIRAANERLEKLKKRFRFGGFDVGHTQDEAINDYSRAQALKCQRILKSWPENNATLEQDFIAIINISWVCSYHGFDDLSDDALGKLALKERIKGVFLRLQDEIWWKRRTRSAQGKAIEAISRELGFINRVRDIYCSDLGKNEYKRRKQLNLNMMEKTVLENNDGDQYTLADLAELSNANPVIRRTELMIRIAGFELWAKETGFKPYFYTLTCPSKYHAFHKFGHRNSKFNGSSQREAQDYFCKLWARFRAKAKRETKAKPYPWEFFGFRVAEPHHDGTPHWHLLLFIHPDHVEEVNGALSAFALEEDGTEKGAWEHRFKVEKIKEGINPETGNEYSAAGYIAKYISKSIDGEHVDVDQYGQDAKNSAEAIIAWSSRNKIRQFQQVGGPSVSVWRELRRLGRLSEEDKNELTPLLKVAVTELEKLNEESAAKAWQWYCRFADENGLSVWRVEKTVEKVLEAIDRETGEVYDVKDVALQLNHYGEMSEAIHGIEVNGNYQKSRFHEWKIVAATDAEASAIREANVLKAAQRKAAKQAATQALLENVIDPALAFDFALDLEARSAPRTGVNNCTEGIPLKTEAEQKQISFDLNGAKE